VTSTPPQGTRDPSGCPHKRTKSKGLARGTDDGVEIVSSSFATCLDCGATIEDPLNDLR
jgi:hypothetical protein